MLRDVHLCMVSEHMPFSLHPRAVPSRCGCAVGVGYQLAGVHLCMVSEHVPSSLWRVLVRVGAQARARKGMLAVLTDTGAYRC